MKENYKELFKNTGILAISNFSSKVLVFLLVPIYTRALSTSEYGFYDLTYTTIQLCFPLLTADICDGVMRFLMKKDISQKNTFSIGVKYTFLGCFLFLLGLIINDIFNISALTTQYAPYIFTLYAVLVFDNLLIQFAKGLNRVKEMAIAGLMGTVSMVILNILLLIVFNFKLYGFYVANISSHVIPIIYFCITLNVPKYLSIKIDKKLQKSILLYSIPLVLNQLGWWVNNTSDRYIVSAICGVDQNGLISVAYKIPNIVAVIGGIFIQAWQISVIKENDSGDAKKFFSTMFIHFNAALCILSGLLILFVRVMARIFFANDFYQAWKFVPFLIISSLLNEAAGYVGAILSADMNSKAMARSAGWGIVVNIGLNILLCLAIGPQGITIATMISSFIIYSIREKATNGKARSGKYKMVIFSWILLVIASVIMIYTDMIWMVAVLVILLFFMYRKTVLATVKMLEQRLLKTNKKRD
jgi:O-antigen/teichoic acid export membrane protein